MWFSHSVLSDSLWPYGLQHAKIPCPAVSSRLCSNLCPFSQWCHLTVLCSVAHFSSFLQYSPASESLPMSWPLASNGQSIEVQLQHQYFQWIFRLISFRIDWFDLLSVQGTLKRLLQHPNLKASNLWCSAFFMVQHSHTNMTTRKTIALTIWTFVGKVMALFLRCFQGLS